MNGLIAFPIWLVAAGLLVPSEFAIFESTYHYRESRERMAMAITELNEAKPKDLHETRDPLRGRPLPEGTHRRLAEALGGCAAVRPPEGTHARLTRTLVG